MSQTAQQVQNGAASFFNIQDKLAAIISLLNTNSMTAEQIQAAAVSFSEISDKLGAIIYLLESGGGSGSGFQPHTAALDTLSNNDGSNLTRLNGCNLVGTCIDTHNGNVGIGTTGPTTKLNVTVATNKYISIANTSASGLTVDGAVLGFSRASDGAQGIFELATYGNDFLVRSRSNYHFYTNATEKLTVLENGNVGIMNTSPATNLDIFNSTLNSPTFQIDRYNNSAVNLFQIGESDAIGSAGSFGGSVLKSGNRNMGFSANATGFASLAASDIAMTILTTGKVGIGTTTPGSKLSVVGLPTSPAGLSAGDIWVDTTGALNILKIV